MARTTRKTNAPSEKYLLYIDILGFSELVRKKGQVQNLYRVINSLNVHSHDVFRTIVFSDTILVYNHTEPTSAHDRHYLIMFLCEFAQDLFYRLIPLDLHFRAYLCKGSFTHQRMQHIESFYGEALVRAYERESDIQCCGLFIENDLLPDCDIFLTEPFDGKCSFVHIMQHLDLQLYPHPLQAGTFPIPAGHLVDTDGQWYLAPCLIYLKQIHGHMTDIRLPPRVRNKYLTAWHMIRTRHRVMLDTLEAHNFDPTCISQLDWSKPMKQSSKAWLGPRR